MLRSDREVLKHTLQQRRTIDWSQNDNMQRAKYRNISPFDCTRWWSTDQVYSRVNIEAAKNYISDVWRLEEIVFLDVQEPEWYWSLADVQFYSVRGRRKHLWNVKKYITEFTADFKDTYSRQNWIYEPLSIAELLLVFKEFVIWCISGIVVLDDWNIAIVLRLLNDKDEINVGQREAYVCDGFKVIALVYFGFFLGKIGLKR